MEIINYFLSGRATERYTILILLLVALILGIILLISGIKIINQNKLAGIISIILGVLLILVTLYLMFWTIIFGFNS